MPLTKTVSVTVTTEEMQDALSKDEAKAIATAKGLYVYDTPQGGGEEPPQDEFEWVKIADENQNFTLREAAKVRYGSDKDKDGNVVNAWIERDLQAGTYRADNAFFTDPVRGVLKRVEVWRKKSSGGGTTNPPDTDPGNPGSISLKTYTYRERPGVTMSVGRGYADNHLIYGADGSALSVSKARGLVDRAIGLIRFLPVYLGFQRNALSDRMLDKVEESFVAAIEAGVQLVMRSSYTFNEAANVSNYSDAPINVMLQHVEQLEPLWRRYAFVFAYLEAGFIGRWGEWNKSTNRLGDESNPQNVAAQRQLIYALLDALPVERSITLRYHSRMREIFGRTSALSREEAYDGSRYARTGKTNDYFTIDSDDANFFRQHNLFVPQGGEPIRWNSGRSTGPSAEQELINMRWQHMNLPGGEFASSWRGSGHYDRFAQRLGHRLILESSRIPEEVEAGQNFFLDLIIRNDGYGKPYNPFNFELLIGSRKFTVNPVKTNQALTDNRHYLPDPGTKLTTRLTLQLPQDIARGEQPLKLRLVDPLAPERIPYMIKFANESIYDSATGGHTLANIRVS